MNYLLNDIKFQYEKNCLHFNPLSISHEAELEEGYSEKGYKTWKHTGWHKFTFESKNIGTIGQLDRIPVSTRGRLNVIINGALVDIYDAEFRGKIRLRWLSRRKYKISFRGRRVAA